jgi:uncharacterized membrane protein
LVAWPVVRQAHHERLIEPHCWLRAYFFGLAALAWLVTGKELP